MKLLYSILIFIAIVLGIIFAPYYLIVLVSKFIIIKHHYALDYWLLGIISMLIAAFVIGISFISIYSIHKSLK